MESAITPNRTLKQTTLPTEQVNKVTISKEGFDAPSPHLLSRQMATRDESNCGPISMLVGAELFTVLPREIMLHIIRTWHNRSILSQTCTLLNQQFLKLVEWDISNYVDTNRPNLPRVLRSKAGVKYFQVKILDCAPHTILRIKNKDIQPEAAKELYAQSEVKLRTYLEANPHLTLSDEQIAALKKYGSDGFFSIQQFRRLKPEYQQELINILTQASIQGHLDSYALLDKVDVTQPPDISKFLVFLRILNTKLVQDLLNKNVIKITDLTNATISGVNAFSNIRVLEYCKERVITEQQVLSLSKLAAKALCDPWVQNLIDSKNNNRRGQYCLLIGWVIHARKEVLRNLLDQDVRALIYIDDEMNTDGRVITMDEFLRLNDDGQRLLRDRTTMQLFRNLINLKYYNSTGSTTLLEYWHVLKGRVDAVHVHWYTTPELSRLLIRGKYEEYISEINAVADQAAKKAAEKNETNQASECIVS
jgi:hypothetical protein